MSKPASRAILKRSAWLSDLGTMSRTRPFFSESGAAEAENAVSGGSVPSSAENAEPARGSAHAAVAVDLRNCLREEFFIRTSRRNFQADNYLCAGSKSQIPGSSAPKTQEQNPCRSAGSHSTWPS